MKIAIDAMGGDKGAAVMVPGVLKAKQKYPHLEFILFGDEKEIQTYLPNPVEGIEVVPTTEVIDYEDEPVRAVRRKKDSSLVVAAKSVKEGQADAILSAGNTGALLAAGLLFIGRISNIERPGLMTTLPVVKGEGGVDFIDLGANAESKPEYLNDYAVLGSTYAQLARGVKNPRVALLNNGTEKTKGNPLTKEAYQLLSENKEINFIGNIEAREILNGVADVVVADGFTGNAVLKSIEGTALSVVRLLKQNILELGLRGKLGAVLLGPAFKKLKAKMDYTSHNGAVLMGVKAPVIKTHGSSTVDTIVACIEQIEAMVDGKVIPHIVHDFEQKENML